MRRAALALKLCVCIATLVACAGVKAPSLDLREPATMRAVLAVGAEALLAADKTCALLADTIATHAKPGDLPTLKRAAALNDACNKVAHEGRDALLDGEAVLDAYNDGRQGEVACAALRGLEALRGIVSLVRGVDEPSVPTSSGQADGALSALVAALPAPVCPVPAPAAG